MPRLYKGTETILKLYVPSCDENNIDNLKIGLFTDNPNKAAEFYSDSMTLDGGTVSLRVDAWSFDFMNDGLINYVATIETDSETIIHERQSNYFLKTPNVYTPTSGGDVDLSNYYTKEEIDDKEDFLKDELEAIHSAEFAIVSGDKFEAGLGGRGLVAYLKTINGESLIGTDDITIPQGTESTIVEVQNHYMPTVSEFNALYESAIEGKPTYVKYNDGVFAIFAHNDSDGNRGLYHFYSENYDIYSKYWYKPSNENKINVISRQIVSYYGLTRPITSPYNDIKMNVLDFYPTTMPTYFWESEHADFAAPLSISINKSASMILDGKLYYWDITDLSTKDGDYYYPKIIDLANTYTKAEIDSMIGDINNILTSI